MSAHHYFPRLRWKTAEWEALQELPVAVLTGLTPIFDFLDIDWDFPNKRYAKSLANYLNGFGSTLQSSWPLDRPVLLDVEKLDKHGTSTFHPLDTCCQDALAHNKFVVPVYSPHYSNNYLLALRRNNQFGVGLKLKASLLEQNQYHIDNILLDLEIKSTDVDLIIDLEDMGVCTHQQIQQIIVISQNLLSHCTWRNVIISSTCYPTSQSGIPQHQIHLHRREEWVLWSNVIASNSLIRTPSFSDYPTASAKFTSVDPRHMSQYAAVRYSTNSDWIFVKGTAVKGNGWGQTQQLCGILVGSIYYSGPTYSWGDEYINERSQGINKSGGSKEWRKVAHTHHLKMVTEQLRNFSASYPVI
ncbi:beta family protein [Vibrio fluvialis]|uniref:beta family protein n=1 Tax=Vibrio fluvialis TaxID=676 RepID=UPI001F23D72F|nr:beta family protein [Vibrio fluvialis]MCE7604516.1 beta family protein [Vibrio fluvialis]